MAVLVVALLLTLVGVTVVLGLLANVLSSLSEGVGTGDTRGSDRARTQTESAAILGDAVRLAAASSHPPFQLRADKVMRVATTRPDYPLQQGQHLVGVRYSIRNEGTRLWGASSPYLSFAALTSSGSNAHRGYYAAVPAKKLMPAAFNLQAGHVRRGIVVFSVPNGAKLVRVSVRLGFGSDDGVEWLIP